jgi:hypothetical protein
MFESVNKFFTYVGMAVCIIGIYCLSVYIVAKKISK